MDPNRALEILRKWSERVLGNGAGMRWDDHEEAADAFEALSEWLSKGGALPDRWSVKR